MSDPADTVTLHIKTELQYDVDSSQGSFPSGSVSQLCTTISDSGDGLLNAYYISNGRVFNATENPALATAGATNWSINDMNFPTGGSAPFIVRALAIPNTTTDLIMVVTQDGLNLWMITTGVRYPIWKKLVSPNGNTPITDCMPFITTDGSIMLSAMSGNGMFIADPNDVATDGWGEDIGVRGAFSGSITSYAVTATLGKNINNTTWGYGVASSQKGLGLLTGGFFSLQSPPAAFTQVDTAAYQSVTLVPLPNNFASSQPLVFAVDQTATANYFQIGTDGKFSKLALFSGVKVTNLSGAVRSKIATGSDFPYYWIELFALDASGNVFHLESAYDDIANVNSFVELSTGDWAVTKWRSVSSPISTGTSSIALSASATEGNVSLLTWTPSTPTTPLILINQDPETSDYQRTNILLPSTFTAGATTTTKTTVYYVEVSVRDGNRVPGAGRATIVSSVQYSTINANGRMIAVDSNRTATVITNEAGNACFTLEVENGLAVPTFTIWAEGMAPNTVVDIQPNGAIQGTLSTLTVTAMRQAVNNDDPSKGSVFSASLTDKQLQAAADSVKEVINIVDPGFTARNAPLSAIDPAAPHRRHIYNRTKGAVAYARSRNARPLGRIRGKASHGVHITFRPHLKVKRIYPQDTSAHRQAMVEGFLGIDLSWGDIWDGVKNGFNVIQDVLLDPIVNGIKATINFIKDGITYAWNGLVDFVQQAYDVITEVFEAIGAKFAALFGWLAWLLNWDDIKRTAQHFQDTVNGFQAWSSTLMTDVLPMITQDNFNQLKTWISSNFDAAKTALGGQVVGTFDKDSAPTSNTLLADDDGGYLDDLPSTATWLLNKIFNAGGSDSAALNFSRATDVLDRLWSTFQTNVSSVGINQDLKNAYTSIGNTLTTFKDRGIFDATSWASLLDVAKNFILVLCDVVELAVLTLESVFAEVLNFFFELINSSLNIPIVSSVFKYLTGVELTLLNTSCFVMAIPYNLVYKVITGNTPFTSTPAPKKPGDGKLPEAGTPVDDVNVSRGVVTVISGLWISITDLTITGKMRSQPDWVKRTVTGLNITLSTLQAGLGGYPVISGGSGGSIAFWAAFSATPPLLNVAFAVATGGRRGPAGDPLGLVSLGLLGGGQAIGAFYQTIATKTWNDKTKALIAAAWFAPWTNLFRWMAQIDNPYVKGAQFVINLVSGLGTGISLIVAGTSTTQAVVFLGHPNHISGSSPLTMMYHHNYKKSPKYVEYLELLEKKREMEARRHRLQKPKRKLITC